MQLWWIETIEAPKYPWPIDAELAARGKRVFEKTCGYGLALEPGGSLIIRQGHCLLPACRTSGKWLSPLSVSTSS